MVHHVYRVDGSAGTYALKQYLKPPNESSRVAEVWQASENARRSGLPAPRLTPNREGRDITETDTGLFVLTEYVHGRQYPPGTMPSRAAFRMGGLLEDLLLVLAEMPAPEVQVLPGPDWIAAHLGGLITIAAQRRHSSPVDEAAYRLLTSKLAALEEWEGPPPAPPAQWIHADYHWRNVIFDGEDRPIAIVDFDNLRVASIGHEVMRCLAYSFPDGQEEAFAFFEGYARASPITPADALEYVRYWRYNYLFRVWPLSERYLVPELYQPRWDVFIHPHPEWWVVNHDQAAERLAAIAASARAAT